MTKQYMVKVDIDTDGDWSYDKIFDYFISPSKEKAFYALYSVVDKLANTSTRKDEPFEYIRDVVNPFIRMFETHAVANLDDEMWFDKDTYDIGVNLGLGNYDIRLELVEVEVQEDGDSLAFLELGDI